MRCSRCRSRAADLHTDALPLAQRARLHSRIPAPALGSPVTSPLGCSTRREEEPPLRPGGGPKWRRGRAKMAAGARYFCTAGRGLEPFLAREVRARLGATEVRAALPAAVPPHTAAEGGGELLSADRKLVSVCVCVSAYFPKVDYVLGKVFFTTAAEPGELKELKSGERLFLLLKKCVPLSVSRNKGTARCSALEAPTLTETAQVGTVCPPVCFHVLSCAENGLKMALNICPSCWHGGACSLWH